MNSTKVMRQAKLNSWAESIRDQQEGSLTVAEWCDLHNVTKHQFYYWKKKLQDQYVESHLPEILPLPIESLSSPNDTSCTSRTTCATIPNSTNPSTLKLSINDFTIEISEDTSEVLLGKVIKAVRYA